MNNGLSTPSISVAAVAKHNLRPGSLVGGIGSFDTRGVTVRIEDRPHHVPISLLQGARATRFIEKDHILTFDDVTVPNSLALRAWCEFHVSGE